MLRGPGSVLMRLCTRLVSRSSATTCDSVSAVTKAMAVPPSRRAGAASGIARASGAAAAAARSSRLFMNRIRLEGGREVRDLSTLARSVSPAWTSRGRAVVWSCGGARTAGLISTGAARDERAWVRGAQRGSASDLEALFRAHWPRAHRAAYLVVHDASLAEDIAQEAFLAAVRNLDRFDRRRPFGPWLHRIVVNRAIDAARARTLRREAELDERVAAPESAAPPDRGILDGARCASARAAGGGRAAPPARLHAR